MTIGTVVFDIGETLIDERRRWTEVARRLGVPPHLLFAVVGGLIAEDRSHRELYDFFEGVDADRVAQAKRVFRDVPYEREDLYPDAAPALADLRAAGFSIGIAGNQPMAAMVGFATLGLASDFIASSAEYGVSKPDQAFFARVAETAGVAPAEIAYVGDRLDNDVLPAIRSGMAGVFLRRGPWGLIQGQTPDAKVATIAIDGLIGLADRLKAL